MEDNKKREDLKFIIYLDDDDKKKEKYAFIKEDAFWVEIQLADKDSLQSYGEKFKIPKDRVLKIKEVGI